MKDPRVLSFVTNDIAGKAARFTIGTDIIDYIESSKTFGREDLSDPGADGRFQRRMVAIPDKKGTVVTPMVLTISNHNKLYLVRKDDEFKSGDGWKLIDLSKSFKTAVGDSLRVRAHAAAWTEDDKVAIAVAVDDGTSERSRVFVAYDLSTCTSDWENIAWTDCGSRTDVRVEGIRILNEGDGVWTTTLVGDRGPNDTLYLLRSDSQSSFANALVFDPAVTLEEILDFEMAVHPTLGSGIVVLGTNSGSRDLSFRPFPTYTADGRAGSIPPVEPLPCPAGANVLETGLTRQLKKGRRRAFYGSDIYIGGQGVQQIKALDVFEVVVNGGDIKVTEVTPADAAPNVQDLTVGDAPDGSASVWALLQNGDLNVVKKAAGAASWSDPLRVRVGIQAIAPVHGDVHLTTSLLTVYANGQASFLCKEANQGLWQERPLTVANPDEVTSITCYGTTLRVLNEGSLPQAGVKVKVSASVLSSVVLNGSAAFVGPTLSFETETNGNGAVSLLDRVRSLTPAIYRFEIDGFEQAIDINPASGMQEGFQSMTAAELRSATITTATGSQEPLLSESFRRGADKHKVDVVASSLNRAAALMNATNDVATGVSQVDKSQPFSSVLQTDTVEDSYQWGIHADENGVKSADKSIINRLVSAVESTGTFFKNVGEGIADFFEGLVQGFEEGGIHGGFTFVLRKTKEAAKDVFEFVCAIGSEIKRFVLKTLEEVGNFFAWLWEQCKVGLKKVWEFFKFIFNWNDVLRVKDFVVDFIDAGLEEVTHFVDSAKGQVESSFDAVIAQVNQWRSTSPVPPGDSAASKADAPISESYAGSIGIIDLITGNSVLSWISSQLQAGLSEIIDIETPDAPEDAANASLSLVTGLITDFADELSDSFKQIQVTLSEVFGENAPSFDQFTMDTFKQLVIDVGAELIETLLQLVKKIIMRVLDMIKYVVTVFKSAIFAKIRFPFIEKLVKFVTAGQTEIDTSFRLVDAVSLLFAVPATIMYKIIYREAPLKPGDTVSLPFGDTISVQSGMGVGQRIVNIISIAAQLSLNGILIFDSLDKKRQGNPARKALKAINAGAIFVLFATRITNGIIEDNLWEIPAFILNITLLTMFGLSALDAYLYKKPRTTTITFNQEKFSTMSDCMNFGGGIIYAAVGIGVLIDNAIKGSAKGETKAEVILSPISDILTGLPITLAVAASYAEDPYFKAGFAIASGLSGFAGLCVSIEYLVQASLPMSQSSSSVSLAGSTPQPA